MAPLVFMLVYFLGIVHGAAHPDPTPPAVLEKRQFLGAATVWSPTIIGTSVSYGQFGFGGTDTITTSGTNWNWCSVGVVGCLAATACVAGTVFYPGTSFVCSVTQNVCGTEYLYSTEGAAQALTRPACYPLTGANTNTYFLVSPTAAAASVPTTTTPTTTTPTSPVPTSPSPTPQSTHSSTPVGAIVGGVIGGLALIAIVAVVILLLLRRRKSPSTAAQQPGGTGAALAAQQPPQQPPMQQQAGAMGPPYDNKHASYAGGYPYSAAGSPLPQYQNPGEQQFHQQQPQNLGGYYPQQGTIPSPGAASPPMAGAPGYGAAAVAAPHSVSPPPQQQQQSPGAGAPYQQPQYGNHPGAVAGPVEMPGHDGMVPTSAAGPVEMHADQPHT